MKSRVFIIAVVIVIVLQLWIAQSLSRPIDLAVVAVALAAIGLAVANLIVWAVNRLHNKREADDED